MCKHKVYKLTTQTISIVSDFIEYTHWNLSVLVKKVNESLALITSETALGSENLKWALSLAADQTCTILMEECLTDSLTELLQLRYVP